MKSPVLWIIGVLLAVWLGYFFYPQLVWAWLSVSMPTHIAINDKKLDFGPKFRMIDRQLAPEGGGSSYLLLWNNLSESWITREFYPMVSVFPISEGLSRSRIEGVTRLFCDKHDHDESPVFEAMRDDTSAICGAHVEGGLKLFYFVQECPAIMSVEMPMNNLSAVLESGNEAYSDLSELCSSSAKGKDIR